MALSIGSSLNKVTHIEPEKCEGCKAGMKIIEGVHHTENGNPVYVCTAVKGDEDEIKTHKN